MFWKFGNFGSSVQEGFLKHLIGFLRILKRLLTLGLLQETLNYWKQLPHILKYFRAEEDPNARRPQNFMSGFLEASFTHSELKHYLANGRSRVATESDCSLACTYPK